jgi:hypothetical protein
VKASTLRGLVGSIAILGAFTLPILADAATPSGRYVVTSGGTAKGTVYDTKTKLTWQQAVQSNYMWAAAKTYCAGVGTTLGGSGWRLPTIKELYTIVDFGMTDAPRADPTAFPGMPTGSSDYFWSASPVSGSSNGAWAMYTSGLIGNFWVENPAYVRCVR